jgi:tRNA pseudouridine13 synthase
LIHDDYLFLYINTGFLEDTLIGGRMASEKAQTALFFGQLPYVTAKESKITGKIRLQPNDFQVEELESYCPTGSGEHLFVRFCKTGLTTPEAVSRIARALGTDPKEASWAGLKDRYAVTEQWASFHGGDPVKAHTIKIDKISILKAALHPHKLRTGHLRGNKFLIRIRETPRDSCEIAQGILSRLDQVGLPNYYGEQRFGFQGRNLEQACGWIVNGEKSPRDRFSRKFYLSVLQSAIFNDWLAQRLQLIPIDCPLDGDLFRKEDTGGMFVTDDLESVRIRMKNWEISPTGPIFGDKMRWAEGRAREVEESMLQRWNVSIDTFRRHKKYGPGSRRPTRVRPHQWNVSYESDALVLSFQLPKGAYATTVLRELMKDDVGLENHSGVDVDDAET